MAGKISENILTAISTVVTNEIQKLKFDKTVEAVIQEVVDGSTGKYRVKFEGNIVMAYASDVSEVYEVGDVVLMKIPEGDMSNKKTIEGKVAFSNDFTSLTDLSNYIVDVGPGFDKFYNDFPSGSYGLIAGVAPFSQTITLNDSGNALFQRFSKDNSKIKISAEFATNLFGDTRQGNYGLKVTFLARDYTTTGEETTKDVSYTMDITDFSGSPYRYAVFNPQSVVIDVQKDYLLGLKSITFFQEDFLIDTWQAVEIDDDGNPEIVPKEEKEKPNLFVRNINLQFVDSLDLTKSTYYLHIRTPEGIEVSNTKQSVLLDGRLLHLGSDVTDSSGIIYRWYKRNFNVFQGDEEYDQYGGEGWEFLPPDPSNKYLNTLSVKQVDIPYKNEYKLVAINSNENISSATIEIFNLSSEYALSIEQITTNTNVSLKIKNSLNSIEYVGSWYYTTGSGALITIADEDHMVNTIDVTPYINYANVTFYCHVKHEGQDIVELSKTLENLTSQDDFTVVFNGRSLYHYDANGDINVEDSEVEKTLSATVTLRDGYITSYQMLWILENGEVAPASADNSISFGMIKNVYYDTNYTLHYFVLPKFNMDKAQNNTITLRILTVDNQVYDFPYELTFLKDGDQGTNGTTFNVIVRHCDINGNKILDFSPMIYQDGRWLSNEPGHEYYLNAYVYKDGEDISNNNNYTITYQWSSLGDGIDVNNAITPMIRVIGIENDESIDADYFIAKVQVRIKDNTQSGKSTLVYYNFPIDVVKDLDPELFTNVNLPTYIMYSASGVNASYSQEPLSIEYNGADVSSEITSSNDKICRVYQYNEQTYIRPAVQFIGDDFAYLEYAQGNNFLHHTIMMYLNTYGNEAINDWDGTSIAIDEEGNYIYAPQIGAGRKNDNNTFSGVIMGDDSQAGLGLYGYEDGINTFGIQSDGKAYFGSAESGRIEVDGSQAIIRGGRNVGGAHSMTLILADRSDGISSDTINAIAIRGNSPQTPVFSVNYNGKMTANEAVVKGSITAEEGYIGAWEINGSNLQSENGEVFLDGESGRIHGASIDGSLIQGSSIQGSTLHVDGDAVGYNFDIYDDGSMYAMQGGQVGGWKFGAANHDGTLHGGYDTSYSGSGSFNLSPDGNIIYKAGPNNQTLVWKIDDLGEATFSNVIIDGDNVATEGWVTAKTYATQSFVNDAIAGVRSWAEDTFAPKGEIQAAYNRGYNAGDSAGYTRGYAEGQAT